MEESTVEGPAAGSAFLTSEAAVAAPEFLAVRGIPDGEADSREPLRRVSRQRSSCEGLERRGP